MTIERVVICLMLIGIAVLAVLLIKAWFEKETLQISLARAERSENLKDEATRQNYKAKDHIIGKLKEEIQRLNKRVSEMEDAFDNIHNTASRHARPF